MFRGYGLIRAARSSLIRVCSVCYYGGSQWGAATGSNGIKTTESAACQGSLHPTALQDVRARPKGGVMPNKKSAWQVGSFGFAVVFKAVVPYFEPTGAVLVALAVMAILRHMG